MNISPYLRPTWKMVVFIILFLMTESNLMLFVTVLARFKWQFLLLYINIAATATAGTVTTGLVLLFVAVVLLSVVFVITVVSRSHHLFSAHTIVTGPFHIALSTKSF